MGGMMTKHERRFTSKDRITLRHQGKEYILTHDGFAEPGDHGGTIFQWTDGNFGCDCNRSLFIGREIDPEFPEMGCGDTIELVKLESFDREGNPMHAYDPASDTSE